MTIMRSEQLKRDQQKKGFKNFHENETFDLNVTAQELEQQPDLQWELLENNYKQCNVLSGTMEKHLDNLSVGAQQQGEQVPQTTTFEGCVDHLLILAQSAEIVAQSENSVAVMHTKDQNKDQECSQELLDRLSPISHVSSQRSRFCHEVTRPRLTQVRKQARCRYLILDQERAKDNHCKHVQGKKIRLNQIKHQARCKSKNDLSPQIVTGHKNEQPKGRILRLSQMKHQARSKGKSTVKDGTEDHIDESLYCNGFKDYNEKGIARQFVKKNICQWDSYSYFEGMPAHNFYRGASQSSFVRWDNENLKEHQRTARQLRAFKTKKLRQQLRTECKRNSTNMITSLPARPGLTGLTIMTNSQWLSNSATLLEKKRALKANSEAQEEFIPVKRLRLTQLRHEARLGNQYSAMQGPAGN